jgi:hypothetical protein
MSKACSKVITFVRNPSLHSHENPVETADQPCLGLKKYSPIALKGHATDVFCQQTTIERIRTTAAFV